MYFCNYKFSLLPNHVTDNSDQDSFLNVFYILKCVYVTDKVFNQAFHTLPKSDRQSMKKKQITYFA